MFMKEKKLVVTESPKELQNVIEEGSEFEGTIKTTTLRIDGYFKGNIQKAEKVLIGKAGKVIGDIYAEELLIAGMMEGNTYVSSRMELHSTGVLRGNISTDILVMEEGASFEGNCHMQREEKAQGSAQAAGKLDPQGIMERLMEQENLQKNAADAVNQ